MMRLVDELLRFSRLDRKLLNLDPVDCNALVDEVVASFRKHITEHYPLRYR